MDILNQVIKQEPLEEAESIEVTPDIVKMEYQPFMCLVCHTTCEDEIQLEKHKRLHIADSRRFACYACDKFYSSQINLDIHLNSKVHAPKKLFHCGHCQKRFSLKLYLQRHKLRHLRSGSQVKCQDCYKKFSRVSDLLLHQKKHRKRYHCESCNRSFVSTYLLECHKCIKKEHFVPKTERSLKLKLNRESALNDKPLGCNICGKKFTIHKYFKNHLDLHSRVADAAVCDVCFKKFSKISCLRNHMKIHKRFQCDTCDEIFNQKIDMVVHRKIHQKRFPCDVCGRCYRTAYCLKRHQKVHSRPDFLQCDHCEKRFRHKYSLNRHFVSNHSRKTFDCNICGKDFLRSQDLQLHKKLHEQLKNSWDDSPGLLGYLNFSAMA